jgi:hypothetical protein
MERPQAPHSHTGKAEISDADLARFLILFAGLWFRTHQYPKAGMAQLAAVYLRLISFLRGPTRIQLEEKAPKPSLRDPAGLVVTARRIFANMTSFDVPPFIRKIINEMSQEAHALLTYYLLVIHPEEESCG